MVSNTIESKNMNVEQSVAYHSSNFSANAREVKKDKYGLVKAYNPNGSFIKNIILGFCLLFACFGGSFVGFNLSGLLKSDDSVLADTEYSITINSNGGEGGDCEVDTYLSKSENQIFTLSIPYKDGYDFGGWTASGYTGTVKAISNTQLIIGAGTTGNITLTANWQGVTFGTTEFTYDGSAHSPVGYGYTLSGGTTSATNAGDYTTTAVLEPGRVWSDGTTANKTLNWSIAKATVKPVFYMKSFTRAAGNQDPESYGNTAGSLTYYYNQTGSNQSGTRWITGGNISQSLPVGVYYMYAVSASTTNYASATSDIVRFEVFAKEGNIAAVVFPENYTYNGSAHNVRVRQVTAGGINRVKYGLTYCEDPDDYTYLVSGVGSVNTSTVWSSVARTNAGTTRVYYALGHLENSVQTYPYTGYLDFVIEPRNILFATIDAVSTQNFTGGAVEPTLTVKDSVPSANTTLVEGTDYVVSYSNNIKAGYATATITGIGNYTGTKTTTFQIQKTTASLLTNPTLKTGLQYNGSAQELITAGTSDSGTIYYGLGASNSVAPSVWSTSLPTATLGGVYYVWYSIAGDRNHDNLSATYLGQVSISNDIDITLNPNGGTIDTLTSEVRKVTFNTHYGDNIDLFPSGSSSNFSSLANNSLTDGVFTGSKAAGSRGYISFKPNALPAGTIIPGQEYTLVIQVTSFSSNQASYNLIIQNSSNPQLYGNAENREIAITGTGTYYVSLTALESDSYDCLFNPFFNVAAADNLSITFKVSLYQGVLNGLHDGLFLNGDTITPGASLNKELPDARRDGYSFDGWYDAASGGNLITASTIFSAANKNTLYAHWTPIYNIILDPTGGTVDSLSADVAGLRTVKNGMTYSDNVNLFPSNNLSNFISGSSYYSANRISLENNIFTFESPAGNNSNTYFIPKTLDNIIVPGKDYTMVIEVFYSSGGGYTFNFGTDGTNSQLTRTNTLGQDNSTSWRLNADDYVLYTVSLRSSDLASYYNFMRTYIYQNSSDSKTVSFRMSVYAGLFSGTGTNLIGAFKNNEYAAPGQTISKSLPIPTRTGYVFEGWFTAENGGTQVFNNTVVNLNANQTLYAHWSPTYEITLDPNGGSVDSLATDVASSRTVKNGGTYAENNINLYPSNNLNSFDSFTGGKQWTEFLLDDNIFELNIPVSSVNIFANFMTKPLSSGVIQSGEKYTAVIEMLYHTGKTAFTMTFNKESDAQHVQLNGTGTNLGVYLSHRQNDDDVVTYFVPLIGTGDDSATMLLRNYIYIQAGYELHAKFRISLYKGEVNSSNWAGYAEPNKVMAQGLPTPTRSGYVFEGWYDAENGGNEITDDSVVALNANQTLYAHWAQYSTITLNANGGNGGTGSIVQEVGTNSFDAITIPTRDGYRFTGYFTNSSGGTKIIGSTAPYTSFKTNTDYTDASGNWTETGNVTLYAQWTPESYYVTYDTQDGESLVNQLISNISASGLSVSYREDLNFFTVTGTLSTAAWSKLANTRTVAANNLTFMFETLGGSVTANSAYVRVHNTTSGLGQSATHYDLLLASANTSRVDYLDLTRNGNNYWMVEIGGDGSESSIVFNNFRFRIGLYTVAYDNTRDYAYEPTRTTKTFAAQYGDLPTVIRPGYTFDGWYTESSGGTLVQRTTTVSTASHHTLYAHWTKVIGTVTYNANGGSCDVSSNPVQVGSYYGSKNIYPELISSSFNKGALVSLNPNSDGWNTIDSASSGQNIFAYYVNELIHPGYTYTLVFEVKDIVKSGANNILWEYNAGSVPQQLNNGISGRVAIGTEDQIQFITMTGSDVLAYTTSNHFLMRAWFNAQSNTYSLKFRIGLYLGVVNQDNYVYAAHNTALTNNLPTPTRDGYTFDGWYTQAVGGTQVLNSTAVTTAEDHSIYAHWSETNYTLTFDANNGTVSPASLTYDITDSITLPTPTRANYIFTGWKVTTEDGNWLLADANYTNMSVGTGKYGNATLTAQWTAAEAKVTHNAVDTNYITLEAAFSAAATGDTITILKPNIDVESALLVYNKILTLTSNCPTVITKSSASNIYLFDLSTNAQLTIEGGNSTNTITFRGNRTNESDGDSSGIIFNVRNTTKLYLNDYVIVENFFNSGSHIISNDGIIEIDGLTLQNNKSNGTIRNYRTLLIESGTFYNNYSTGNGGVVYNSGTLTIEGGSFSYNHANSGVGGGVIFNSGNGAVEISGGTFEYNTSTYYGSVIVNYNMEGSSSTRSTLEISGTAVFRNNSSNSYNNAPIYGQGNITISGGTFEQTRTVNLPSGIMFIISGDASAQNVKYYTNVNISGGTFNGYNYLMYSWSNRAIHTTFSGSPTITGSARYYVQCPAESSYANNDVFTGTGAPITIESGFNPSTPILISFNNDSNRGYFLETSTPLVTFDNCTATTAPIGLAADTSTFGLLAVNDNEESIHNLYMRRKYTVTYAMNGGTGSIASETRLHEEVFNISSTVPTKTGYTFTGWNDGSQTYASGASYTMGDSNITLTAQWTPTSYTLKLDANSGSIDTSTYTDWTLNAGTYNKTYNITTAAFTLPTPTRTGYSFTGWKVSVSDGNWGAVNTEYEDEASISGKYGNATLTAQWSPNSYTLKLNANSGSIDTSTYTNWTLNAGTYNKTYNITTAAFTLPTPTRTGYSFDGWKVSVSDGNWGAVNTEYEDEASISGKYGNTTLTAQWNARKYTITLNNQSADTAGTQYIYEKYNDGFYLDSAATANKMTTSTNAITPPTKTGYTFGGYYTNTGGGGAEWIDENGFITSTITATYSSSQTIYAQWIPNGYTITYNANGGTGSIANETATYNSNFTLNNGSHLSRNGYTLDGWATSAGGNVVYDLGYVFVKYNLTNGLNLYAHWSPISYRLTLDTNGGTIASGWGSGPYSKNYSIESIDTLPTPTRSGYTFTNWKVTINEGSWILGATHSAGTSLTGKYGSATLTAQWAINTYAITYNANGGTGSIANETATYNSNFTLNNGSNLSRTGYTLDGWATSSNGNVVYDLGYTFTPYTLSNGLNLYAHWSINTYAITYNSNGGTGYIPTEYVTYNSNATLNGGSAFVRTGYTLDGWATSAGGNVAYALNYSFSPYTLTTGLNLYAHWSENSYTITIAQNGGSDGACEEDEYTVSSSVQTFDLTLPTRTGYTFDGWVLSGFNGTVKAIPDTTLIIGSNASGNITLTAQWTANEYTINYYANGGTGIIPSETATYDDDFTLNSGSAFTKANYTLDGWATSSNGAVVYALSYEFEPYNIAGGLDLYAHWTANIYAITLNNQSADTAGTTTIYEKYSVGFYLDEDASAYQMTLLANPITTPVKSGYIFLGYYTQASGEGTQYIDENGNITNDASATNFTTSGTLYAYWILEFSGTINIVVDYDSSCSANASSFIRIFDVENGYSWMFELTDDMDVSITELAASTYVVTFVNVYNHSTYIEGENETLVSSLVFELNEDNDTETLNITVVKTSTSGFGVSKGV